jgi:hypothetical protein
LEITVSFLGIHKWDPDIYNGFSPALPLHCGPSRVGHRSWMIRPQVSKSRGFMIEVTMFRDTSFQGQFIMSSILLSVISVRKIDDIGPNVAVKTTSPHIRR